MIIRILSGDKLDKIYKKVKTSLHEHSLSEMTLRQIRSQYVTDSYNKCKCNNGKAKKLACDVLDDDMSKTWYHCMKCGYDLCTKCCKAHTI